MCHYTRSFIVTAIIICFIKTSIAQICFGINTTDPTVCSTQGACVGNGTCSCNIEYTGLQCEFPLCFNISSNSSSVCGGNGFCDSPDDCICNTGFFGQQCNNFTCYGTEASVVGVCSGNGICTTPDNCVCNAGYSGLTCSTYSCFGTSSIDPSVCSSQGVCSQPDMCSCNVGYGLFDCSQILCYGVASTDPLVCSGNGVCSNINFCDCDPGFEGLQCQSVIRPPPVFCIVDKDLDLFGPDAGYIYFPDLTTAVRLCRSQPIQDIRITSQIVVEPGSIDFIPNNANQQKLLISKLTPLGDEAIIVGSDHQLTSDYNEIEINNIVFQTNNFSSGMGYSTSSVSTSIFRGEFNTLIMVSVTLQSIRDPLLPPSLDNQPDASYGIVATGTTAFRITSMMIYGSLQSGIEVIDGNSLNPGISMDIDIIGLEGRHQWGRYIRTGGVANIEVTNALCTYYCGGLISGVPLSSGLIAIEYKNDAGAGGVTSIVNDNILVVNDPTLQTSIGLPFSGIYLQGGTVSTLDPLQLSTFQLRDNVVDGYGIGLRLSSVSDDVLGANYRGSTPIIALDSQEKLRQTALENGVGSTIGNIQGLTYDLIRSPIGQENFASSDNICNDYCIPDELCCNVNSQYTALTTPDFNTFNFTTIQAAIAPRPGGCAVSPTILRCVILTRGLGISATDSWEHVEDVNFNQLEPILVKGELGFLAQRVRWVTNSVIARGNVNQMTLSDLRLHPLDRSIPILSTSSTMAPSEVLNDITLNNLYVAPGLNDTDSMSNSAILLNDLGPVNVVISDSVFKPNLASEDLANSSPVRLVHSSCGTVSISGNEFQGAANSALFIENAVSVSISDNVFFQCGTASVLRFPACLYVRMCTSGGSTPVGVASIVSNQFSGASDMGLKDQFVGVNNNKKIGYSMLYLELFDVDVVEGNIIPELSGVSMNEYGTSVPIRERVTGLNLLYDTGPRSNERTGIRAFNLNNTGNAFIWETVFSTFDDDILASEYDNLVYFCSGGCPPVDVNIVYIVAIVVIIILLLLCLIGLLAIGFSILDGESDTMDRDSLLTQSEVNIDRRNRVNKTFQFLKVVSQRGRGVKND